MGQMLLEFQSTEAKEVSFFNKFPHGVWKNLIFSGDPTTLFWAFFVTNHMFVLCVKTKWNQGQSHGALLNFNYISVHLAHVSMRPTSINFVRLTENP